MIFFTHNILGKMKDYKMNIMNQYSFTDEQGKEIFVTNTIIDNTASFSDKVESEEKVARSVMVEKIQSLPYHACTIVFNKKPDLKVIKESFYQLYPNKGGIVSEASYKKSVDDNLKTALDGEERTLIGYYLGSVDTEGRLLFFDAEEYYSLIEGEDKVSPETAKNKSIRLVDPRTVKSLILNSVKYTLKK